MRQNIQYHVISHAVLLSIMLFSNVGYAKVCSVAINDIKTPLVPKTLTKGDREFDGNGPQIKSTATLKIGDAGRKLYVDVFFKARETKADWSTTEEIFSNIHVWTAPSGQRISKILSNNYSQTYFLSQKAGFQILGPTSDWGPVIDVVVQLFRKISGDSGGKLGELCEAIGEPDLSRCAEAVKSGLDVMNQENYVHVKQPDPGRGNLVSAFFIVGDTGGDDISDDNNPKDDTRIEKIAFNKVILELEGATTCPPMPALRVGGVINPLTVSSCAATIQGKIAWDYKDSKQWQQSNISRLCRGAEESTEPARCFNKVMHGGISWGGGTSWQWKNVIDLCEGSTNANSTISCFQSKIQSGKKWQEAIQACGK